MLCGPPQGQLTRLSLKCLSSIPASSSIFNGYVVWGGQILTVDEGGGTDVTHWNPLFSFENQYPQVTLSQAKDPKSYPIDGNVTIRFPVEAILRHYLQEDPF